MGAIPRNCLGQDSRAEPPLGCAVTLPPRGNGCGSAAVSENSSRSLPSPDGYAIVAICTGQANDAGGQIDRGPIASMAQETEGHAVPPEGLNWWATVRDALPDDDVLAAAVAEELHEPLEDVRPSVMTATLVRRVDASLDDLKAVVDGERERARVRGVDHPPARGRTPGPRGDPRGSRDRDAPARGRRHARPARGRCRPARGGRHRGALGDAPGAVPRPARRHPPPRLGPLRRRAAGRPARCRCPWARWAAGSSCGPRSPRSWSRTATGPPSARSSPVTRRPAAAPSRSSWASSPRTR